MNYYTVKGIEEMISVRVCEAYQENKWTTIVLENGMRIKIKNF